MDANTIVAAVLSCPLDLLEHRTSCIIGTRLPLDFLATLLDESDKIDALRACMIIYLLTATVIVPRGFQLQASLATLNGKDSIITAGTGSGKTLCIIIPLLLRPESISITVSPLKRLQATQVRYRSATKWADNMTVLSKVLES
ncbi:hypothetical protein BS17DRAFT_789494 [Gyrodon lividus]|nr:hypothetical protein BS17DRAFT_789494 [Gyrodon lividus]